MGRRASWTVLASAAALAGCASNKAANQAATDEGPSLPLAQVSAPARAAIERATAGGRIDNITRETERGRAVYDVEATVNGKHAEWTVADSDGAILGREWSITLADLPAPVRAAAASYFDKGAPLTIMQGEEYGETSYEVVGAKNGKRTERTWDASGKPEAPEAK